MLFQKRMLQSLQTHHMGRILTRRSCFGKEPNITFMFTGSNIVFKGDRFLLLLLKPSSSPLPQTSSTKPVSSRCSYQCTTLFFLPLILLAFLQIQLSESNQIPEVCDVYGDFECGSSSSSKLLIKGGTVVNAHHQELADVYVENGIIVTVQPNIKVGDDVTVLDATEKYVMPVNGSLSAGFEGYTKKAQRSCMDYGFHMPITKWDEVVARDMEIMVREKGINSSKFFLAYEGVVMVSDELLLQGFKKCKSFGALAMVHAENGDAVAEGQIRMIDLGITGPEGHALSRSPLEGEATSRAIRLAAFVNTPLYVVHARSIDAMEEIAKARKSGQRVVGEPIVSGLVLDDSWLWDNDFTTAAKQEPLVGTDHCTYNSTQKALGIDDFQKIPNGVNGNFQFLLPKENRRENASYPGHNGGLGVNEICSAQIFNIYPRKGAIFAGSDADIIIFNPNSSFEISVRSHHLRSDTNVYEGRRGKVFLIILNIYLLWLMNWLNYYQQI
ncbi:hypothetical protein IFM89_031160 [Coptis chinensis]|uniref:Dihydropyrimidinase n=1 Tax=Coptis chinensis TaxID=261450 RepID=A0A835MAE7_9MAGN|nr:hypothetical protein IFM89_031160 [Coptis chinensis]